MEQPDQGSVRSAWGGRWSRFGANCNALAAIQSVKPAAKAVAASPLQTPRLGDAWMKMAAADHDVAAQRAIRLPDSFARFSRPIFSSDSLVTVYLMLIKIALILLMGVGIGHLGLGIVYMTADEFMSYHSQALAVQWDGLSPSYQTLLLALIRLSGAGAMVAALVNLYLSAAALLKNNFAHVWLAPVVALIYQLTANYVVYTVAESTPGEPPLMFATVGSLALLSGSLLLAVCLFSIKKGPESK